MRRIHKGKPKEISMCFEGANRRLIASYKSTRKPNMEELAKGGPGSAPQKGGGSGDTSKAREHIAQGKEHMQSSKRMTKSTVLSEIDMEKAIANCSEAIMDELTEITKSAGGKDGEGYTPQAASIIKAVGRLIAPFSKELTLKDLAKIGKAAGLGNALGGDESEMVDALKSASKSVKNDEDEDEEDEGDVDENLDYEDDDIEEEEPVDSDVEEAEEDDSKESFDEEDLEEDEEEDEDEEEVDGKVKKSWESDFALAIKKRQAIAKAARADSDEEDEDDEDDNENSDKGAPPWLQGRKAKGANMAKSAVAGASSRDATSEMTELQKQRHELREELRKTKSYLEQERAERQLENIKKSVREDYAHLAIDDARLDVLAPMLKSMREAEDQSGYENFSSMLKSWNDQVNGAQKAGNIFTAIGKSSANAATKMGTAEARLEARVDEEMKKSTGKVNRSVVYDAFTHDTVEGRELLAAQRREERGL